MRDPLVQITAALALLMLVGAGPSTEPPEDAIVVTGQRIPIIVNGRVQRCRPLPNDPQDRWSPGRALFPWERRQSILLPKPDGSGFELVDDHEQMFDPKTSGGPGIWRRVGPGIDQYVFRAPKDGSVLCIGSKGANPISFGQLRQIIDATPYRGKRLRFTAWVATRKAGLVRFWLASGDPDGLKIVKQLFPPDVANTARIVNGRVQVNIRTQEGVKILNCRWEELDETCAWLKRMRTHPIEGHLELNNADDTIGYWLYNGGNTNQYSWGGSHRWTPVMVEIGPVNPDAVFISFGFLLHGYGDVWVYNPKLEVVGSDDPDQRTGDMFVIGGDHMDSRGGGHG